MVTHTMLRTHKGGNVSSEKKNPICMPPLDLIKCLNQRLLFTCAPISGLPSNVGTMTKTNQFQFPNSRSVKALDHYLFKSCVLNLTWLQSS